MADGKASFSNIDEYLIGFPQDVQAVLQTLRETIKAAAPDAQEKISYGMPAFALKGNLVYFAAWKKHIALYPGTSELPDYLKQQLAQYEGTKGSVHFPLDQPLPLDLIREIVEFRVAENRSIAEEKAAKKK